MQTVTRAMSAAAVLAALALPAQAQFTPAPLTNPNAFNAGATGATGPLANLVGRANGGANFFNPANLAGLGGTMSSSPIAGAGTAGLNTSYPYGSNFPYLGYGTYIPANMGNLYGSAEVINSLSKYMTDVQQAKMMREQVNREHLETRRRVLEQWLWERNNLPTTQDEFERSQRLQLRRSQNDPPTNEIFAGRSLNDLLSDIQRHQSQLRGKPPMDVPLPDNVIGQINFSPKGKGAANAGMLKEFKADNKLGWPTELRGDDYEKPRELLTKLTRDAIQQASTKGEVDVGTLNEMDRLIKEMSEELRANLIRKDLPPAQALPARKFLDDLSNAVRALGEGDVKKYFNGQYTAAGKTAAELANDMQNKGLEFGPATQAQRAAYVALHRLLAAYDIALNSNAGVTTGEQQR